MAGGNMRIFPAFVAGLLPTFLLASEQWRTSLCSLGSVGSYYTYLSSIPESMPKNNATTTHALGENVVNQLSLPTEIQYEIPRQSFIIWKSKELGIYAKAYHEKWQRMEPTLARRIVLDDECRDLAAMYHPNETNLLQLYDSFPLNVMRADTCRLLVIYFYGGIYMDLDVNYVRPIDQWFAFNASSRIQFGHETPEHFCNWFFGGTSFHPCIAAIIDVILERGQQMDESYEHFVHQTTGPAAFTEGLRRCGGRPVFTRRDLLANNIKHLYASINWKNVDKTYSSWTDARDAVNQKAAEKKEYEKKVAEAAKKGHQIGKLRAKIKVR